MNRFTLFLLSLTCFACVACEAPTSTHQKPDILPPVKQALTCLPENTAYIAAHRGTSRDSRYPENSRTGLEALIKKGYFFAEIDVARLKDGTHITIHDGVFDRTSVITGIVPAARWKDVEGKLLKDWSGRVTSDTIPKLEDILAVAKDRIYLEIDFKSSANYRDVTTKIRQAGLARQVILIAYNNGQARRLAQLAPDMMISVPVKKIGDIRTLMVAGFDKNNIAAWIGDAQMPDDFIKHLNAENIPLLAKAPKTRVTTAATRADILVDDYAFQLSPIMGLTRQNRPAFFDCLTRGNTN